MYCRSLLFLIAVTFNYCSGMELEDPKKPKSPLPNTPCIYLLNGNSTAGKSSIALELAKLLEHGKERSSLNVLAIDTFFGSKIPLNFLWSSITPEKIDKIRKESHQELCLAAKAAYEQKLDVIIDTVVYKNEDFDCYAETFKNCQIKWILVYCPMLKLVERVIQRNENSGITEQRSVLQALDQFNQLYHGKACENNIIDAISPQDFRNTCALVTEHHPIMQQKNWWFINNIQNAICPDALETILASLRKKFMSEDESTISPARPYDLVVNTKLSTSADCADGIIAFFQ